MRRRINLGTLLFLMTAVSPAICQAAASDCEGMEIDGQAKCIDPQWTQLSYDVCDEHGPYLYIQNAWAACATQLGTTSPITDEGTVLALANCLDKKLGGPNGGNMSAIQWDAPGVTYTSNLCYSGTSIDYAGHHLFGIGHTSGAFGNYTYTRRDPPSCPAGYTDVTMKVAGISRLVACKPNPVCPAGTEFNATKNACVVIVDGEQCRTCPELETIR